MPLRQTLKTLLPRPLLQKARAAAWSIGDLRHGLRTREWGLPPAYLRFKVCGTIPPEDYLDERLQLLWLDELHRVAKAGATLILTVNGTDEDRTFEFVRNTAWSDFFPDYYQTTFHGRTYIAENWARGFTILDYVPHAIGQQDAVVLRKI